MVENSLVRLGRCVGSLPLLRAKREGKRAHGKDSGVVEIAKNLIKSDFLCISGLQQRYIRIGGRSANPKVS
jgi:hypothetical protein